MIDAALAEQRGREMPHETINWQPIETLPDEMKDGRRVYVRRIHEGSLVSAGWAVFGVCHADAPQRESMGVDPLRRISAADLEAEDKARLEWANTAKWLRPDRMYSFPTPTHWALRSANEPS